MICPGLQRTLHGKGKVALVLGVVKYHYTLHKPVVSLARILYVGALILNSSTNENIQSSVTIEMAKTILFLTAKSDATQSHQLYNFLAFKSAYIRHVPFELVCIRNGVGIINSFTLCNSKTYIQ